MLLLIASLLVGQYSDSLYPDIGSYTRAISTTSSVTLAVSSSGVDGSIPGRPPVIVGGDYSSYPFATIQAAIRSLPQVLANTVAINVGAGNFEGAYLDGLLAGESGYFPYISITGSRTVAVPATGVDSGTATSGTTSTLTLAAAGWTTGDLQGRILHVTSGNGAGSYMIATNDATTIQLAGNHWQAFNATSVFVIEDLATHITSGSSATTGYFAFYVDKSTALITINDIDIDINDANYTGIQVDNNPGSVSCNRVLMSGGYLYNGFIASNGSILGCIDCGFVGTSVAAFSAYGLDARLIYSRIFADGPTVGLRASHGGEIDALAGQVGAWFDNITGQAVLLSDCGGRVNFANLTNIHIEDSAYGIHSTGCNFVVNSVDIDNSSAKTIYAVQSEIAVAGTLTGTGNAGFGLDLAQDGAQVSFVSAPTITGALGDATLDGVTASAWADIAATVPVTFSSDLTSFSRNACYPDNVELTFGGTCAAPDYKIVDDGTTWGLNSTDVDGVGTPGALLSNTLGTPDLTLTGALIVPAGTSYVLRSTDVDSGLDFGTGDDLNFFSNASAKIQFSSITNGLSILTSFLATSGPIQKTGAGGILPIGGSATTSHALTTGDTVTYQALEVNGDLYADANTVSAGHLTFTKKKTGLTNGAPNAFTTISVAQGEHIGGTVHMGIHAADATDLQARTANLAFVAINSGGTVTCDVQFSNPATQPIITTSGTLTATVSCADSTADGVTLSVTPTSSLTPTTLEVHYHLVLDQEAIITAL